MKALDNLIAVLCDPAGKCSIHGSDEDRRIVDDSLAALKAALAAPQPMSFNSFVRKNYEDLGAGVFLEKPQPVQSPTDKQLAQYLRDNACGGSNYNRVLNHAADVLEGAKP
jgi:hypothetical protein